MVAAQNYAEACIAMGGDWVRRGPMTKRLQYLYFEVGHREEMENSWNQHEEMESDRRWEGERREREGERR